MHKLRLLRACDGPGSTLGILQLNQHFLCFTLEDEFRDIKVKGETRIPAGIYALALRNSPKFSPKLGHDVIWVQNVPNFEWILIHPGNTDDDTDGCILVGNGVLYDPTTGDVSITGGTSLAAYRRIYAQLSPIVKSGELTHLEVYNSVQGIKKP